MQRVIIFYMFVSLASQTCFAKEIKKSAVTSIRFDALTLRMEQSDSTRLARQAYAVNIHQALKTFSFGQSHFEINVTHAPDTMKKSSAIDIRRHFQAAHLRLGLSYVQGFRYKISTGVSLWRSQTSIKLREQEKNREAFLAGSHLLIGMDYAIFEHLEISANATIYVRYPQQMLDWSHGLGLQTSF